MNAQSEQQASNYARCGEEGWSPITPRPVKLRISDCAPRLLNGDRMQSLGKGCQERLIGENIDSSRQSLRCFRNQTNRVCRKYIRTAIPSCPHPKVDVSLDIDANQGFEPERLRNAFV